MKHPVTMLNPETRYGECPCGKHYSFFPKPKPTKKDPERVEWICLKRRTKAGKKIKAVRETTRSYKQRQADRLWSQLIKSRGKCELAGVAVDCSTQLHPHHIIGRSDFSLRFDPENGMCICAVHHRWAHDHGAFFGRFLDAYHPGLLDRLHEKSIEGKGKKVDYDIVIPRLKELLNEEMTITFTAPLPPHLAEFNKEIEAEVVVEDDSPLGKIRNWAENNARSEVSTYADEDGYAEDVYGDQVVPLDDLKAFLDKLNEELFNGVG